MILSTTLLDFGVEIPSGSRKLSICSIFKIQLCLLFVLKVSREVLKGVNLDYCALVLHFLGLDMGTKFKYLYLSKIFTTFFPKFYCFVYVGICCCSLFQFQIHASNILHVFSME